MRSFFLSILLLFVYSPFSLGFTTDVYYIETAVADSVIILDTLDIDAFADVYAENLNFASNLGIPSVNSSQQLIAATKAIFRPGLVLQDAITTQRIAFVGPTDKDYAFTEAKGITYLTSTVFGTGNLTGQIVTVYNRYDDTFVKTSLPGYGGWRIASRFLTAIGVVGNLAILPPGIHL
ncbi:hypothetical protein MMC22_004310 [Lobaria immixta]|nr:hypothetical protein [Lobaria immixta]